VPRAHVDHVYSRRDLAARRALAVQAAAILKIAGAALTFRYPITTFSHALGTVRMGTDQRSSALDPFGGFRGMENLYVTDASSFPTAGGVNPSLTIAATALRAAEHLVGTCAWRAAVQRAAPRPGDRPEPPLAASHSSAEETEHV
jgi:choline dehydrogenase-like flavoprotein